MKIFNIPSKPDSKITDFENFFNVYKDQNGNYKFNLNSSVYFDNIPYNIYNTQHDMYWNQLSFILYETTALWWLLMKVNNVGMKTCMDVIPAGTQIKYPSLDNVKTIITNIS